MRFYFDESGDFGFRRDVFDCYTQAAVVCPESFEHDLNESVRQRQDVGRWRSCTRRSCERGDRRGSVLPRLVQSGSQHLNRAPLASRKTNTWPPRAGIKSQEVAWSSAPGSSVKRGRKPAASCPLT